MLGANINDRYDDFNRVQIEKLQKFFEKIDQLEVHPHLKFTMLRLCGSPKLVYYARTTPPEHSNAVTQFFDTALKAHAERIIASARVRAPGLRV